MSETLTEAQVRQMLARCERRINYGKHAASTAYTLRDWPAYDVARELVLAAIARRDKVMAAYPEVKP